MRWKFNLDHRLESLIIKHNGDNGHKDSQRFCHYIWIPLHSIQCVIIIQWNYYHYYLLLVFLIYIILLNTSSQTYKHIIFMFVLLLWCNDVVIKDGVMFAIKMKHFISFILSIVMCLYDAFETINKQIVYDLVFIMVFFYRFQFSPYTSYLLFIHIYIYFKGYTLFRMINQ